MSDIIEWFYRGGGCADIKPSRAMLSFRGLKYEYVAHAEYQKRDLLNAAINSFALWLLENRTRFEDGTNGRV